MGAQIMTQTTPTYNKGAIVLLIWVRYFYLIGYAHLYSFSMIRQILGYKIALLKILHKGCNHEY